jgi:hypothetical protein
MYEVKDGSRILQFEGRLLGSSSSQNSDSTRWIEFKLYKTENGSYILSRVGVSLVFHGSVCHLVGKYKLNEAKPGVLSSNAIPCEECLPSTQVPLVFPEKERTWAQVSDGPEAVLEALYKHNYDGSKYLTKVAKRLLEEAASVDERIDLMYRIEVIP